MGSLEVIKAGDNHVTQPGLSSGLMGRFLQFLDVRPRTVETYAKALRRLFDYFSLRGIRQPLRGDLVAFREDLKASGHKPATVQGYITAARLFFAWTAQEGLYPNIADRLKGAKLDRAHKKDYLTSHQVKGVLEGIGRGTLQGLRDYAIVALMVTGGLRTIEVVRADVGDLRALGDATVLYIQGKGEDEKAAFIKISEPVERAIRAYLSARGAGRESDPLFASGANKNKGGRMTTRSISRIAKGKLQGAGYDSSRLTAHSLRHTAVTLALLSGESLQDVQAFARHSNISTTMLYNHAIDMRRNSCSQSVTAAIF